MAHLKTILLVKMSWWSKSINVAIMVTHKDKGKRCLPQVALLVVSNTKAKDSEAHYKAK